MTLQRFAKGAAIVVTYVAAVVALGELLGDSTLSLVVSTLVPLIAFEAVRQNGTRE